MTLQSLTCPTKPTIRRPAQLKITEDDFNWCKPVAVILKPASKRDLQQRLLQASVEEILFPSSYSRLHQPSPLPPWPFVQDYWALRRWENDEASDRLRDLYSRYELPGQVKRKLLSLAGMGLVAVPRMTKINRQRSGNNGNQGEQNPEQSKKMFYYYVN